jgi:serine protease Do
MATVLGVEEGANAHADGFRSGDVIVNLEQQPLLSIADFQWVLHNAGEARQLRATIRRDGREMELKLTLPAGWRRRGNLSWRATSWDLRRMTTGGLVLEELSSEEKTAARIDAAGLALRVKYVGQYDEHAAGKNAGFLKGDILMAKLVNTRFPGDLVAVEVLREGARKSLKLPIQ